MEPNNDRPTDAPPDDLEAGLRAAFAKTASWNGEDAVQEAPDSVFQLLSSTLGRSARLSLRDLDDEHSPVVRTHRGEGSLLPERVGRYRITGEIATGGVGSVFRAHDIDLGRDVAFKVLRDRHTGNPDITRRFLEEAQIGGQLQHPGIVAVHEMGLLEGTRPFFTMKLVKGQTLSSLLRERQNPAEERQRFLGIFAQICQTIAYAHARGVIHRDLKPSNVMVGAFGEVQVMDWGLAKVLARGGAEDDRQRTKTPAVETVIQTLRTGEGSSSLAGSVLGTPAYMAPEQARGAVDDLDETSDVFGLGAVLCEILTGEPPYRGESVEEVHRRARDGDLADAHARVAASGADAEIVALARRCLACDRAVRPRHAGTVAREVRQYLDSLEARAREERVRAARARMRAVAAAAVVVVIAAVGLSGLWLEMERRDALNLTASQARALMAKAEAHLARAGSDPAAMLGEAAAALEAFQTAKTMIDRDALPALGASLDELGTAVERSIRRARFLVHLEQNRSKDAHGIDRAYDDAFTALLGTRIFALPPRSVAERIRANGLETEAARALDDWALARRQAGDEWRSLVEISIAVDRSAARVHLWDLLEHASPEGLAEHLVQLEGVTPAVLCAAGAWAEDQGQAAVVEKLYRRALELEPGSFRAHAGLGMLLCWISSRTPEGLSHLLAAHALEPDRVWILGPLASGYAKSGDAEGAMRTLRTLLAHRTANAWEATDCVWVLERPALTFSSASLDGFIASALDLSRKEERFASAWWQAVGAALVRRYCPGDAQRALEIARGEVERTHRRDAWVLLMLSMVEAAAGRQDDALRTLEESRRLPDRPPSCDSWIRGLRRAVRPRLVSYASIDAVLDDHEYLIKEGDSWRYFKGTRSPSEEDQWTRLSFDDKSWLEGASGIGYGDHDDATVLDDMQWSYLDVYARRALEIPDPSLYSSIVLSVDADDGFSAWVNGELLGAWRMDPQTGRVTEGSRPGTPVEIELTGKVQAGRNVLAIRVGNESLGSPGLSLIPQVGVTRADAVAASAARAESVRAQVAWDSSGRLAAYLDGRLALDRGALQLAAQRFRQVLELDRTAIEPFERLREAVARSDGEEAAERAYTAEVARGAPVALLNTPPAAPEGLRAEEEGPALVLSASSFRHADARVLHAWTRWQVRTEAGDYDRTPTIDILSATRLTRLAIVRHMLAPRTRYFWRVKHYAASGAAAGSTEAAFTTGDYSFEAIPFDLAVHFTRDVVANPGDAENDYADSSLARFIVDGFDGRATRSGAVGLPLNRAVGLHRLADYNGPNALQFGPRSLLPIRIRSPGGSFSALRILVTGSHGDAIVPLALEYADGGVERTSLHVEDWYDDPEPLPSNEVDNWLPVRDGGSPVLNGMNREWVRNFDAREDAALFELTVPLDPARPLHAVVVEPAAMAALHDPAFALVNIFSIVGVRVGERNPEDSR